MAVETKEHQFQHPNAPTWCKHCGEFSHACRPGEACHGKPGAFDATTKEGRELIAKLITGQETDQ